MRCRMCLTRSDTPHLAFEMVNTKTGTVRGICAVCLAVIDAVLHSEPECENELHAEDARDTAEAVKRMLG